MSYDDGSNCVWIGILKHSTGILISSNQMMYPDAFAGLKADILCKYKRSGFECDLVFREKPSSPTVYGLSIESSRLQLFTEFFDTQDPQQIPSVEDGLYGLQDRNLKFGALTMTHGKAFAINPSGRSSAKSRAPVFKTWAHFENRTFLIEELPLNYIAPDLGTLPSATNSAALAAGIGPKFASAKRVFPAVPRQVLATNQIQVASAGIENQAGVVLDYVEVSGSLGDYTFQADTTYLISGPVQCDTATFQGGTIIKYATDSYIEICESVSPDTSDRPAILTCADDNSVGANTYGYGGGGNPAILVDGWPSSCPAWTGLNNMRFFNHPQAVVGPEPGADPYKFTHCHFINCGSVFQNDDPWELRLEFDNCLISTIYTSAFVTIDDDAPYDTYTFNNCTVDNCAQFVDNSFTGTLQAINAVNCIFSQVGPWLVSDYGWPQFYTPLVENNAYFNCYGGPLFGESNGHASDTNPFQSGGSANYYLADNTFRNIGDGFFSTEMQSMTTFAPEAGGIPDTDTPDLGYHYPTNEDSDYDGLPDLWELKHFGGYSHSGTDLDVNGNTLLYDYEHDSEMPSIAISAPANNSSATTTRINVTGTFVEPFLSRITVNGVIAFASGSTFEALNVPLQPGANTVSATIEDITGKAAATSITVNGSAAPVDPVQVAAAPIAGFSPLGVTFQATANVPGTLQQVLYDFEGDGVIDQTVNNLNSVSHSYSNPGEYFPAVTVVTSAGRFSSLGGWSSGDPSRLTINVQAPPVVNSLDTIAITDPVDIKTTASGNLYVLSGSTATISEYDSSHSLLRSLSSMGTSPSGLDVDNAGNVYVAVTGDNQVLKFNPTASSFQLDTSFGTSGHIGKGDKSSGSANGEFHSPFDVAVTPDGTQIVVSDSGNNRIEQFTVGGNYISSFGELGNSQGQFNTPKGLTFDGAGYLYIVDSGNNRLELMLSAVVVGGSGASGTSVGQFQGPINLAVGSRGIYVADTGNNRVQEFDPLFTGEGAAPVPLTVRGSLSSEVLLSQPSAVAPIEDLLEEKIYIADTGHDRVVLVKLPHQDPLQTWNDMKSAAAIGDVAATVANFSALSKDGYRKALLSNGAAISSINSIGALTPVYVRGDDAKYYFTDTVDGQTITFPVECVKENGIWKILDF